jgi:hypothetical protein
LLLGARSALVFDGDGAERVERAREKICERSSGRVLIARKVVVAVLWRFSGQVSAVTYLGLAEVDRQPGWTGLAYRCKLDQNTGLDGQNEAEMN